MSRLLVCPLYCVKKGTGRDSQFMPKRGSHVVSQLVSILMIIIFDVTDSSGAIMPSPPLRAPAAAQEPLLRHGHIRGKRGDLLTKRGLRAVRRDRPRHHCVTAPRGVLTHCYLPLLFRTMLRIDAAKQILVEHCDGFERKEKIKIDV